MHIQLVVKIVPTALAAVHKKYLMQYSKTCDSVLWHHLTVDVNLM